VDKNENYKGIYDYCIGAGLISVVLKVRETHDTERDANKDRGRVKVYLIRVKRNDIASIIRH
jgi:hypothetical protein